MDHEDGDGHADDESDGDDAPEDPDDAARGALRHWLLCGQRGTRQCQGGGRSKRRVAPGSSGKREAAPLMAERYRQ